MRKLIILGVALLFFAESRSQMAASGRFIRFADLTDPANAPFNRPAEEISLLLFKAATDRSIPIYHFDSFEKPPITWTPRQLGEQMDKLDRRYKPWQKKKSYATGDRVSVDIYRYRSMINSNRYNPSSNDPSASGAWKLVSPPDQVLGLDVITSSTPDSVVRYVHLFTDDRQYEVSFAANDAAGYLNSTHNLWYRFEDHFMHHLEGDVFLFDLYDKKKVADLGGLIDSAKLKISPESLHDSRSMLGLLGRFDNGKLSDFILSTQGIYEDRFSLLDTVPLALLREKLDNDSSAIYRIGDALLKPALFFFSSPPQALAFHPPEAAPVWNNIKAVDTVVCPATERFRLEGQPFAMKDAAEVLNLLYEGISENKLPVYDSDSLIQPLGVTELIKRWSFGAGYIDEWKPQTAYREDDNIIYQGQVYSALASNTGQGPPPDKPALWKHKTEAQDIYQPEEVRQIAFRYMITFTSTGRIVRKIPESIGLDVLADDNLTTLGYFRFGDVKTIITERRPDLWKKVSPWMERQNGVYQQVSIGPLKSTGK